MFEIYALVHLFGVYRSDQRIYGIVGLSKHEFEKIAVAIEFYLMAF